MAVVRATADKATGTTFFVMGRSCCHLSPGHLSSNAHLTPGRTGRPPGSFTGAGRRSCRWRAVVRRGGCGGRRTSLQYRESLQETRRGPVSDVPSDEEFLAYNEGVVAEFRANRGV